ncbi:hypothetical protein [Streptococcus agalactiae]|uniref:hypothetical protein n=1 Tax=Streptococcus agalactiae TaxID=1311 RepID=UPI0002BB132E|nr:hypothetical protein [Streptococcus agalactiae]EPT72064.1 hypothetical protein SAG0066_10270 [Streptococcus agalactiae CCUG 38383]EPT57711.1 hypothetical protein SAG0051_11150 [Streptococcus agalactiae CCUG 19094]EPT71939.1 hypothetical protein SAG0065_11045 [Streptococcus agalactiae CCUG 37742]EPT78493.1 hypothetical protein SAG0070_10850 [Streptococcus agalactiae CCUG 44077]EPW28665.1 hypothetical protein SAG0054_11070 [Streptococcus agalactiae CCUG 28551]
MKDKLKFSERLEKELKNLERVDLFDDLNAELSKFVGRKNITTSECKLLNEFCEKLNGKKGAFDCYEDLRQEYEEILKKIVDLYSLVKNLNEFN